MRLLVRKQFRIKKQINSFSLRGKVLRRIFNPFIIESFNMKNKTASSVTLTFNKKTQFHELKINGMLFLSPEKDTFYVPETLLRGISITSFPKNITIVPFAYAYANEVMYPWCRMEISNEGNNKAIIEIEACLGANLFIDMIGVRPFQQLKKDLILQQVQFSPKINLYYFEENTVHLHYSIILPADDIQTLIEKAHALDESLTEKVLSSVPDTLELTRDALMHKKPSVVKE